MKKSGIRIKRVRRLFLLAMSATLILSLYVSPTLSWLLHTITGPHSLNSTTLTLHTDVYFVQPDNSRLDGTDFLFQQYYLVDIEDEDAPNYLKKLRVDLKITGTTKAYIRVFTNDMWLTSVDDGLGNLIKTVFIKDSIMFNHPENCWTDNRLYDSYFYYTYENTALYNAARPSMNVGLYANPDETETVLPFITGINEDVGEIASGELHLEIRAEIIQFNRIEAFWNITELPLL